MNTTNSTSSLGARSNANANNNNGNSGTPGNTTNSSSNNPIIVNVPTPVVVPSTSPTPSSSSSSNDSVSTEYTLAHPFDMPRYDQTDTTLGNVQPYPSGYTTWFPNNAANSSLCAPTAGAMALGAVLNKVGSSNLNTTSSLSCSSNTSTSTWVYNCFNSSSVTWQQRVINLAYYRMGTDPVNGTYFTRTAGDARNGAAALATSFSNSKSTGVSSGENDASVPTTPYSFIQRVRGELSGYSGKKFANIIMIGYYKAVTSGNSVTFTRQGGHFLAIEGYNQAAGDLYTSGTTILNPSTTAALSFYNPWGREIDNWQLGLLKRGYNLNGSQTAPTITALPSGQVSQAYVYSDSTQGYTRYWIIEGVTGLSAN